MKLQIEKIKISNTLLTMTGLFVISLVAFAANVASAQERTGNIQERVEDARENVTERVESLQENVAERTASATEAFRSRASTTPVDLGAQSESRREAIQERLIEQRTALTERQQQRIRNLAANMSNRMDAVVVRFEQIIERLRSRIQKLSTVGVDTIEAEGNLVDAELSLQRAIETLASIDTVVADVVGSQTPWKAWQRAKEVYQDIRTDVQATHQSLRATVTSLKTAVNEHNATQKVNDAVENESNVDTTESTEGQPEA